jgi:hypothetical protein
MAESRKQTVSEMAAKAPKHTYFAERGQDSIQRISREDGNPYETP